MKIPSGPRTPVSRPLFCPRKERPYHDPETAREAEWFLEHGEFFTDDGMEIAWHDEFNGIWSSASLARLAGGWRT